jgi:hypothetical protein
MKIDIIECPDRTAWNDVIAHAFQYDYYHCNSYNRLDVLGKPFLFVASSASDFIALPLVKRKIENTGYLDCTSVWGYPGPVASKPPWETDPALINYFQENLRKYMHDEKIVSVFSRMHPIIPQDSFFSNL